MEGLTLLDGSGGEPGTVTARIEQPLASDDPDRLVDALDGCPDLVLVTTKVASMSSTASLAAISGISIVVSGIISFMACHGVIAGKAYFSADWRAPASRGRAARALLFRCAGSTDNLANAQRVSPREGQPL